MFIELGVKLCGLIERHWRGFFVGVLAVFLCLKVQSLFHKVTNPSTPTQVVLPKNDKEIINVSNNKVTITTSKGTQTVTGSRDTVITEDKSGNIKITEKTDGWEHQLGFGGYVSSRMGLALDLRYFYLKGFDAMAAVGYVPQTQRLDGFLALGYTPSTSWMSNTMLYVGYSPVNHAPVCGISLKF
jgi:hypothetical protein